MDGLLEALLTLDTMILVMVILGVFIAYMLYSGEVPMRWLGSLHRDSRPVLYWLGILLYLSVLGVVVYAWMEGVRIPLGNLFD